MDLLEYLLFETYFVRVLLNLPLGQLCASFSVSLLDLLVKGSCLSIKHVPVIGKNHFSHQRNIFSLFSVYVGQILSSDLL